MKQSNVIINRVKSQYTSPQTAVYSPRSKLDKIQYETKIISNSKIILQSNTNINNDLNNQYQRVQRVRSTYQPTTSYIVSNLNYKPPVQKNVNQQIRRQVVNIQSPRKQNEVYRTVSYHSKISQHPSQKEEGRYLDQYNNEYQRQKENYPSQKYRNIQTVTSSIKKINLPILYTSPKDTYKGQFNQNNQFHGEGIYFFNQCNIKYEGQFYNGQIHGYGKLSYQNPLSNQYPIIYIGNFVQARKQGKGKFFYTNQNHFYDGDWINDFKEGKGIYESNQEYYDGLWAKNKKHGEGQLINKRNNTRFKGIFFDDHFIQGTIQYSNGDSYNGKFHLGKKQGQGSYVYRSRKQQYNGQFSNDLRHGKGTIYYSNGDQFTGLFRHGRIDESMNCTYKWADGSIFNGWFKNGKPDKGTVKNNQQKQYEYTSTASF